MQTTHRTWFRNSLATLTCAFVIIGCATHPADVSEIHPGILQGYLAENEYPDSLKLLPAPPADGSAAFARDQEISEESLKLRGTDRYDQAVRDAELMFPAAAAAFAGAVGFEITQADTPYLYMLLRRTLADAGLSTYTAKDNYNRPRPFMVNNKAIGTPDEEEGLRKDGSYPSGHTAIGWAWALILCEVVPEQTDVILARGYEFGQSRVICNVHWQSDVDAGRIMGAAAVARLHANKDFLADLKQAKQEAAAIRKR